MALLTDQLMLEAYQAAEVAVLDGQSYTIAGRVFTMADLPSIRKGREEFEKRVAAAAANSKLGSGASIATWNNRVELTSRRLFGRNYR